MSTAIRPPGGPSPAGAADSAAGLEVESSVGAGGASALEGSRAAGAADAVTPAAAQQVQSPAGALLSRLDAGEITREQAIESLVAEAIAAPGVAHLPAAQRAELETILRASLLDDPTLSRLLG
jgi:hypothetical protein